MRARRFAANNFLVIIILHLHPDPKFVFLSRIRSVFGGIEVEA